MALIWATGRFSTGPITPANSPNGPSSAISPGVISPSITISLFAGTRRSIGSRAHQLDRLTLEAAGEVHLVLAVGQIGDGRQMDRRLARDHPGDRRLLAAIGPGPGVAGSLPSRREIDDDAVRVAQHRAIDAHVLDAGVVIARDDDGRDVGRLVLAGRPGDDRQVGEARGLADQFALLARAGTDRPGLYRMAQRSHHRVVDLIDLALQGQCNAVRRGAERSGDDRNVRVFDVLEQQTKSALDRQRLIHPLGEARDLPGAIDLPAITEEIMLLQGREIVAHVAIGHVFSFPIDGSVYPCVPCSPRSSSIE